MGVADLPSAVIATIRIHELSSVMIEIDRLTRFSWKLFGRPARSERELVTLYGGLLVLGSGLSVAELARMIPSVDADSLQRAIHNGAIPAKRGRTTQQLEAIAAALTLLVNIVMALEHKPHSAKG